MGKKFYYLWVSQILSQVTVNMLNFLLLTKLFNITGSSIATSLLWVSFSLPTIFFGPIGAGAVDLVNRKRVLVVTNFFQALTVLVYVFNHQYSTFLLFIVVMIYSFLNQFYVPAEQAALPSVVDKRKLAKANSLFFITQQLSLIIGFGFAGLIEELIGFEGSLFFCFTALLIASFSVSLLPKLSPSKKMPSNFEEILTVFFRHIIDGYRFIRNKKFVLYPLILLFIIQAGLSIVFVNLPVIAIEIIKTPLTYLGLLVIVPAGIGAAVGTIYINKLVNKRVRKKKIIDMGLFCLGLGIFIISLILPYLPSAGRLISSPLLISIVGFGFVAVNVPVLTYLQEVVPVWLRGRVFGNLYFLITITTIFPLIFSGLVSEFFGVKILLAILSFSIISILMFSIKNGERLIKEVF